MLLEAITKALKQVLRAGKLLPDLIRKFVPPVPKRANVGDVQAGMGHLLGLSNGIPSAYRSKIWPVAFPLLVPFVNWQSATKHFIFPWGVLLLQAYSYLLNVYYRKGYNIRKF